MQNERSLWAENQRIKGKVSNAPVSQTTCGVLETTGNQILKTGTTGGSENGVNEKGGVAGHKISGMGHPTGGFNDNVGRGKGHFAPKC